VPECDHDWSAGNPQAGAPRLWTGLYLAGVLAHFSHHMAFDLPADHIDPSLGAALHSAPTSLVWPADLIHTLIDLS